MKILKEMVQWNLPVVVASREEWQEPQNCSQKNAAGLRYKRLRVTPAMSAGVTDRIW